jgi:ubiquinone/menaquinone biosynthesis C-methylase UbiE
MLAAEAVGPAGQVLGVDYSEGQLGVAEGQRLLRGLPNVRFETRDATRLGLKERFDAALSNLGIPPAYEACFAGMRQALKPGGRLSVTEWGPAAHEPFTSFRAALAPFQDPGHAELAEVRRVAAQRRARFEELGKPEVFAAALRAAGFERVDVRLETHEARFTGWRDALDFATSWGWAEQEVRALDGEDRAALHAALKARWGEKGFTAAWRMAHATAVVA